MATPRPLLSSYPNHQSASLLWYHDHADQTTRLNVYAGLVGFYIIRDALDTGAEPNGLGVPGGAHEIPQLLSDKLFDAAGDLFYSPDPTWIPEFFGDTPVVNGVVRPFLDVEPRKSASVSSTAPTRGSGTSRSRAGRPRSRSARTAGSSTGPPAQPAPAAPRRARRRDRRLLALRRPDGHRRQRRPPGRRLEPGAAASETWTIARGDARPGAGRPRWARRSAGAGC